MYMCGSIVQHVGTRMDTYVGHTCQVEQSGAGYVSLGSILQGAGVGGACGVGGVHNVAYVEP
jgi:hypothetical protein